MIGRVKVWARPSPRGGWEAKVEVCTGEDCRREIRRMKRSAPDVLSGINPNKVFKAFAKGKTGDEAIAKAGALATKTMNLIKGNPELALLMAPGTGTALTAVMGAASMLGVGPEDAKRIAKQLARKYGRKAGKLAKRMARKWGRKLKKKAWRAAKKIWRRIW